METCISPRTSNTSRTSSTPRKPLRCETPSILLQYSYLSVSEQTWAAAITWFILNGNNIEYVGTKNVSAGWIYSYGYVVLWPPSVWLAEILCADSQAWWDKNKGTGLLAR